MQHFLIVLVQLAKQYKFTIKKKKKKKMHSGCGSAQTFHIFGTTIQIFQRF